MAGSGDLIDFDIIEAQKENVQSLPGGRSARELARIFSGGSNDKYASPTPNDTRTLNDAIRQEYESELDTIGESDDPLDVYDRYVKWTLNAYPSAQATPESGLLPLLERATKSFLSSSHYKNDPRYLRLWLHYIRFFSDAPRETFAFLSRHHIGEGLALFYEEFAAWLESAGRWTQAEEVYRLGVDHEARPAERLLRKYSEFQHRYEQQPQDAGPSSPALPKVRPALAAKMDPFVSADGSSDPQAAARDTPSTTAPPKTKSGKPKMAIFSDADESAASQPATSGGSTKGWESIGTMDERKKENRVEAKAWVGETLKAGKKSGPSQKMAIFRDESNPNNHHQESQALSAPEEIPEHHVREAVNPRTGRRERVFVDLEAVYPDRKNPEHEISFEELRAMRRGWTSKNWRKQKEPLQQISGNAGGVELPIEKPRAPSPIEDIAETSDQQLALEEQHGRSHFQEQDGSHESKSNKARRMKVHGETQTTQTVKMKFDSPTNSKVRRKSTREPTMTMHTRAATDEIYDLFNQPLKVEAEDAADSLYGSDYEDDDLASNADSTVTGHMSAASSDFADEETHTFHKSYDDTEYADNTHAGSVVDGDWTEFSVSKDIPGREGVDATYQSVLSDGVVDESPHGTPERERFVPEMPDDYAPPCGTYRDPAIMAQNRLPFMTPIVERTESSIPSQTAARNHLYNTKTPSKPQMGNLLESPIGGATPYNGDHTIASAADVPFSPTAFKTLAPKSRRRGEAIIKDAQCNPTDKGIRNTILNSLEPPLANYSGYHSHSKDSNYASMIQKFIRTHIRKSKGANDGFDTPILKFPGAERSYIIRRELGAGAYAPVYLAESIDSSETGHSQSDDEEETFGSMDSCSKTVSPYKAARYSFEAIKVENGPSSAWEFYMIRTAHDRLRHSADHTRATDSVVRAHELHVHQRESFLVEDYRGQGTLLDLVNVLRNAPITSSHHSEGGLEESLAMFFSVELLRTVEALHANGILHGDIKADNCLVRLDEATSENDPTAAMSLLDLNEQPDDTRDNAHYSPNGYHGWRSKGLDLIDFGRSIDMHAFQPSVQFIADWEVATHECNEIREARPWTHQIDLYGIAGTIHVLLFGKHIESMPARTSTGDSSGTAHTYRIRESLKRYWDRDLWAEVFDLLLNPGSERWTQMEQDGCTRDFTPPVLPVLHSMRYVRRKMEDWLVANAEKKGLALQLRKIETILADRKKKLERS
ncbi:Mad3/BUB1 homology region 1 [Penicillium angulare]|uniref:Mad3/BUB1 homology region 1 n=1 Tax=Penicillium angulare TaxID=116970 RepID=A0A9W9K0A9_9EURO|nr:Mad3/BUB1 homology region 1 [Penicillium angulare]